METPNERLKTVRKALGLSQVELAKVLGIKQGSYSDVERGRADVGVSNSIKLILKDKYRVNIDFISTGKGDMFLSKTKESIVKKDTITIEGHELDFTSVEMAIYKHRERFTREGRVVNLIVKDELNIMLEKIVKENNLQIKYSVKED